jgi:hypothetical protein
MNSKQEWLENSALKEVFGVKMLCRLGIGNQGGGRESIVPLLVPQHVVR